MDSNGKHQLNKNKTFRQAFHHAWDGIIAVVKHERNMRFHLLATVAVIIVACWFCLQVWEWLWILLAIFLVITGEMVNTIVEALVDMTVGHRYHPLAKLAKDMAAGLVLLLAGFAIIVGLLIFGNHLI